GGRRAGTERGGGGGTSGGTRNQRLGGTGAPRVRDPSAARALPPDPTAPQASARCDAETFCRRTSRRLGEAEFTKVGQGETFYWRKRTALRAEKTPIAGQ